MSIYENVSPKNEMMCAAHPPCPISVDTKLIDSTGKSATTQPTGPTIKSQVFLKRLNMKVIVVDDVKFPDLFLEIKDCAKTCVLTQCKVCYDTLIVEGYIIKNISYVSPQIGSDIYGCHCPGFKNNWHDIEVRVPFHGTMELPSDVIPLVFPFNGVNANEKLSYNYKCNTMKNMCCDQGKMGPSPCEQFRVQSTYLNEVPYGDLVGYSIYELDVNRKPCSTDEHLYEILTEKMAVCLTIDLYMDGWATVTSTTPIPANESCLPTPTPTP